MPASIPPSVVARRSGLAGGAVSVIVLVRSDEQPPEQTDAPDPERENGTGAVGNCSRVSHR